MWESIILVVASMLVVASLCSILVVASIYLWRRFQIVQPNPNNSSAQPMLFLMDNYLACDLSLQCSARITSPILGGFSATQTCGPDEHWTSAHDSRQYFPGLVGFVGPAVPLIGRSSGRLYGRIKAAQAPDFHLTRPFLHSSSYLLCRYHHRLFYRIFGRIFWK